MHDFSTKNFSHLGTSSQSSRPIPVTLWRSNHRSPSAINLSTAKDWCDYCEPSSICACSFVG